MYILRLILNRNPSLVYTHLSNSQNFSRLLTNQNDSSFAKLLSNNNCSSPLKCPKRFESKFDPFKRAKEKRQRTRDIALYGFAIVMLSIALTYSSVPLYRLYCQAFGKGGKAKVAEDFLANKVKTMKKKDRLITVSFNADRESKMRWNFQPTQNEIKLYPGETALAFFTAKNPTNEPVNGVSTYSVAPTEAGQYLNKIQCFCFEEQRLDPGEEVDMPVFFYFDPELADDPRLDSVDNIVLSYTFFEAKAGFTLPTFPSFRPKTSTEIALA